MSDSIRQPVDHEHDDSQRLDAHLRKKAEDQFQRQMNQASYLLTRGDGKGALPLLERCRALFPDDVDVLSNLGGAHILAGEFEAAVTVLERAAELAPRNPAVWSNRAAAYLGKLYTANRERQDRALDAYRRVVEIEPHYPNVHYHMGLIHVERREWQDAHGAFSMALESNPNDEDARRMLARVTLVLNAPPNPENN